MNSVIVGNGLSREVRIISNLGITKTKINVISSKAKIKVKPPTGGFLVGPRRCASTADSARRSSSVARDRLFNRENPGSPEGV